MTKPIAAAIVLAIASATVLAQDTLTGKWEGETKNGTAIVLTLAVKDTTVTGTLKRADDTLPISDGKIAKNRLTFKATLNGEAEGFTGELAGDELKVWLDRQGPTSAAVLHRIKSK